MKISVILRLGGVLMGGFKNCIKAMDDQKCHIYNFLKYRIIFIAYWFQGCVY